MRNRGEVGARYCQFGDVVRLIATPHSLTSGGNSFGASTSGGSTRKE